MGNNAHNRVAARLYSILFVAAASWTSSATADCANGFANTCLGEEALGALEAGDHNTALGFWALRQSIDGSFNTAVGADALRENQANLNTAIGSQTLLANTIGNHNTGLGAHALTANTTGVANTAIGSAALAQSNGTANSAIGFAALYSNLDGERNVAVGHAAMYANTTGDKNTALGDEALRNNTSGFANTANGQLALHSNTTGRQNVAVGGSALFSNATGMRSAAIGNRALFNATTGLRNIAVGFEAGSAITSGSDNIVLGSGNPGSAADAGTIRIGNSAYQRKAFIAGVRGVTTGSAAATAVFIDGNGQLGTIKSTRDAKENIQPMGDISNRLYALRPVTFSYRQPYEDGGKPVEFGLIAEEVAESFPELVVNDKTGKPETVRYDLISTLLVNEVKKSHAVIEAQAARIAVLEEKSSRVDDLELELAQLMQDVMEIKRNAPASE